MTEACRKLCRMAPGGDGLGRNVLTLVIAVLFEVENVIAG
jgi:hypothetical protein